MNKSYKIGIDARLYSQTGVGRYTKNLLQQLTQIDSKNHYTIFTTGSDSQKIIGLPKNFSIKITDVRWHSFAEQVAFLKHIADEKLDLVHFPYFSVPILYRRPFITTIHDLTPYEYGTGQATTLPRPLYSMKRLGYKLVLYHAINNACHILVPSYTTKQKILEYYPNVSHKITVTYEGVDTIDNFSKKPRIQDNYFLYVGNAYPHKNIGRLICAFQTLPQDVKLVLVGAEDFFYKRIKQNLTEEEKRRIIFFGQAQDDELANLYTHALALVFPSLSEGFGLPVLEAMAYGCLVIATDIPVFKEICKECCLYVDPSNTSSIALIMKKVYTDKKMFQLLIKKGVERSKLFSWETMAKKTHNIYESCLSV